MSLIEMGLNRRRRASGGSASSSQEYRPEVEMLEVRECMSVAAPVGIQLTAVSSSQVKVTWNDVANETGYRVYRWTGSQSVLAGIVANNVTTFTVPNLVANQVQWFSVQAFDNVSSAQSAWTSIKTGRVPSTAARTAEPGREPIRLPR